ncbi:hypothetical protein DBR47_15960 [Paucibacter sp. KBW04]|nr:hypothetical protein DBR47_15960 [Paucibacter sp. KBW04]
MMNPKTLVWIERLVWIFIYIGALLAVLGLFVIRQRLDDELGTSLGTGLLLIGGASVGLGVFLIWLRSRLS